MGLAVAIVAGGIAAIALYVFFVEPLWVLPWLGWMTPGILYRVKTREALVALSFDDGPHAVFTPKVLEILERHGAKATFFLIGERALRYPELVERIRAAGHEIGNHCWRDGTVLGHSQGRFRDELERTELAIQASLVKSGTCGKTDNPDSLGERGQTGVELDGRVTVVGKAASSRRIPKGPTQKSATTTAGSSPQFFRAPGGVAWPWQLKVARERGYTCVLGCAYPHDPMRPPVKYIQWLIEKNLAPGTIVILHDGIRDASRSVAALPGLLEAGKRRGLRFVSIGELIDSRDANADEAREAEWK